MGDDNIFSNSSMDASVAKRLIVTAHCVDCFTKCVEEDCKCVSFSFERKPNAEGLHKCELNYESKETKNSSFITRDGWDYHNIIYEVGNGQSPCLLFPSIPSRNLLSSSSS